MAYNYNPADYIPDYSFMSKAAQSFSKAAQNAVNIGIEAGKMKDSKTEKNKMYDTMKSFSNKMEEKGLASDLPEIDMAYKDETPEEYQKRVFEPFMSNTVTKMQLAKDKGQIKAYDYAEAISNSGLDLNQFPKLKEFVDKQMSQVKQQKMAGEVGAAERGKTTGVATAGAPSPEFQTTTGTAQPQLQLSESAQRLRKEAGEGMGKVYGFDRQAPAKTAEETASRMSPIVGDDTPAKEAVDKYGTLPTSLEAQKGEMTGLRMEKVKAEIEALKNKPTLDVSDRIALEKLLLAQRREAREASEQAYDEKKETYELNRDMVNILEERVDNLEMAVRAAKQSIKDQGMFAREGLPKDILEFLTFWEKEKNLVDESPQKKLEELQEDFENAKDELATQRKKTNRALKSLDFSGVNQPDIDKATGSVDKQVGGVLDSKTRTIMDNINKGKQ